MKQHVNLKDVFLNKIKEDEISITIVLTNGDKIGGIIEGYDGYTIILRSDGKQQLIFNHAISTIVPSNEIDL